MLKDLKDFMHYISIITSSYKVTLSHANPYYYKNQNRNFVISFEFSLPKIIM